MNHTNLIFVAFSLIVGILVFAIWSNTHVLAQQSPSPSLPSSGGSHAILSELKAKMCDPSNPSLKVVNTTEARICGIPKIVKPPLASSSATPPTSAVSWSSSSLSSSSSPSTQQTTTTESTTVATNTTTPPKQQQVKTSNNDTNAISRPTGGLTGTTSAPVSQPSTNAPQIKAVKQQQQQQPPIKGINGTTGTSTPTVSISSSHTNDGSELLSLLPDLESAIKNKVDSNKNTVSRIKDSTPFLLPFP